MRQRCSKLCLTLFDIKQQFWHVGGPRSLLRPAPEHSRVLARVHDVLQRHAGIGLDAAVSELRLRPLFLHTERTVVFPFRTSNVLRSVRSSHLLSSEISRPSSASVSARSFIGSPRCDFNFIRKQVKGIIIVTGIRANNISCLNPAH